MMLQGQGGRLLALGLTVAMLCPPIAGLLPAAQAQTAVILPLTATPTATADIHTILLFPFANAIPASAGTGGLNADTVGSRIEDAVKFRLNVIGRYKADSFSPALPQVQRALQETTGLGTTGISQTDIAPPFNDPQKAQRIATTVGTDGYLLGSIEALDSDPTTRTVTLTVSAILYNAANGTSVKVLAQSGKGVSFNAADDPDVLLQSAINDVAGQIVSALNASAPKATVTMASSQRGSRSNGGSILLGILLATAVGFAISSSHHSSGGGGSSTTTTTPTTGGGGPSLPPNPP